MYQLFLPSPHRDPEGKHQLITKTEAKDVCSCLHSGHSYDILAVCQKKLFNIVGMTLLLAVHVHCSASVPCTLFI